jgi:sn-glycerol 3-phosphate transport system permease protein
MAIASENPDGGALRRRLPWPRRAAAKAAPGEAAKRVQFSSPVYPYLLLLPQMAIVIVFFYLPSAEAIRSSFFLEDPFGFGSTFVGLENYDTVLSNPEYLRTTRFTIVFTAIVTFFSLAIALLLAVKADAVIRGQATYKTLLMWVYAIAPPVAGLMGVMVFDQHIGPFTDFAALFGWEMRVGLNHFDTAFAMTVVSVWKQVPVNFIFFLSGLQSIPASIREAALIDCRNGMRRFWTVTFPLLAPTAFFLLVINITYALFDTFGVIDVMMRGEPGDKPRTLVYQVFLDGFRGNDLGGSSAQSVILMIVVLALTILQFRYIERRVHYT